MDDLFSEGAERLLREGAPLAARMRPRTLDEFVGQQDVVGPGTVLRRSIESDSLTSLILFGPPGCGKTSLARVIAGVTSSRFVEVSAVTSGVADLRRAMDEARERLKLHGERTILFVDEIHRFTKSQQDALLHAVEDRLVVLIGATTENPFFEVNAPLISRSRVVELHPLGDDDVRSILATALDDAERGLAGSVTLEPDAEQRIVVTSGGDARVALTTLELAASVAEPDEHGRSRIGLDEIAEATATRVLPYDKEGTTHYDVVSAFIKSMRGSDPDAAVYWLARMVHGGEDPKFIARRMLIFASEDVGNADPTALLVADAAFRSAEVIGWPECRINLAQAAIYLAMAPKSNAAYRAIDAALSEVRNGPARQVPNHLREKGHAKAAEALGRGKGYVYPHGDPSGWVPQQYLPDGLVGTSFYSPSSRGWEAEREIERRDRDRLRRKGQERAE